MIKLFLDLVDVLCRLEPILERGGYSGIYLHAICTQGALQQLNLHNHKKVEGFGEGGEQCAFIGLLC